MPITVSNEAREAVPVHAGDEDSHPGRADERWHPRDAVADDREQIGEHRGFLTLSPAELWLIPVPFASDIPKAGRGYTKRGPYLVTVGRCRPGGTSRR